MTVEQHFVDELVKQGFARKLAGEIVKASMRGIGQDEMRSQPVESVDLSTLEGVRQSVWRAACDRLMMTGGY